MNRLKGLYWLWVALLSMGICFLAGLLISSQVPKLRSFILVKIEELSRNELPVFILPGSLDVNLLPLGASLKDVKIMPKPETKDLFDPFVIKEATARISLWQLIQGRLRVTSIQINGTDLRVRPPKVQKRAGPPLAGLFDQLARLPVQKVELQGISFSIHSFDPKYEVDGEDLNLSVEKDRGDVLVIDLAAPKLILHDPQTHALVQVELETNVYASREQVTLSALKLRRADSFIVASGELHGNTEALTFPDVKLKTRGEMSIENMRNWIVGTLKGYEAVPKLFGRAYFDASIDQKKAKSPAVDFKFRTQDFKLEKFFLDRIEADGKLSGDLVKFDKLSIDSDAGQIELTKAEAHVTRPFDFKWTTEVTHVSLFELLHDFDVNKAAVWLKVNASAPCSGHALPEFSINCKAKVSGRDLVVKDEVKDIKSIVAVKELSAEGEFNVGPHEITYKAEINGPHSHGRSEGAIGYKTGFKIGYEADDLNIIDVANLANLKLEGHARIKGVTSGDSHSATLSMNLDTQNFWFENFGLGFPKATVSYAAGFIDIKDLQGHFTVSRYSGDVRVNLKNKTVVVNGRVPFFSAGDLLDAFSRKFKLPVELSGTGQAQIKAAGPFEFTKLSYELKSSLFRGSVAGEPFDQAHFDVHARNGEVVADRVQISHGNSLINLTGVGHPDGKINSSITARGLPIEDTKFVSGSGLTIAGLLDFDMSLSGPVLAPDAVMRAHLGKTSIADLAAPDSNIHMKFNRQTVEGGGSLFGDAIKTEFLFPYDQQAPFALKIYAQKWDYTPLFAALSGAGNRKDYEGQITTRIELAAPKGGFWNATGNIGFDSFSLSRGPLGLKSNTPLNLTMKNGTVRVGKFELTGDNSFLRITSGATQASKLDLQLNGKFDLSLFSMLTPFFEEMRGLVNLAFNVHAGPDVATDVLGSAYLEKGYLKFFDFPHPLEDMKIDMLFNQKRILFNSMRSEFGGGRISASGSMEFHGHHDYPVNVNGSFEKITLNIPEKVKTSGDGEFSITGNWFPYLLKGGYTITSGLITKDFGAGDAPKTDSVRRSYFLPPVLLKENFTPLLVDLQLDFNHGLEIRNDLAEGKLLGNLHVKGVPSKPAIEGMVTADKETKLLFRDNTFDVASVNVQFTGSTELNPKLYVSANTRVQDHDITLVVQGTAQKPRFVWTSVPALAEKDIITLLALGVTDQKLDTGVVNSQQQTSASGSNIATGILAANPLGKEIKNRFGVNLQFSSGFDDVTNSDVQKIIVSRQINKKTEVQASQSIGKVGETEAKVRYRLSDKVSLVGSYLGRQSDPAFNDNTSTVGASTSVPTTSGNVNRLGLDVEYKFEFK